MIRLVPRPAVDPLPREVGVLTAVSFSVAVGFGIVAPAIPVFAREFGVSRFAAGAVIAIFALMRFVSALGCGRLVDRFGERLILASGIGIVAVSSVLAGLAQTYAQLLVLRGAGGVGSAMFTVSAVSLLLRVVEANQRGRASGMFQAGFLVGGITGPAFGGLLAGISLRAPFFVYAGTLAVAGAIALLALRRTELQAKLNEPAGAEPPQRTSLATALRSRAYLAALTANFGNGWALFGLRSALIPLFVVEGLRRDPLWTGIGFLVSSAAQGATLWPAGRLVDTRGRRPFMILGGSLVAASMALLAVSATLPAYLVSMLLFGIGSGFLGVAPAAVVGDVVQGRGGTVVAAFQMAADLGAFVAPLAGNWLADEVSYAAAFWLTTGVLGVGVAASVVMPETARRTAAVGAAGSADRAGPAP